MTTSATDHLLLDSIKQGDDKALEALFVKYYARLCTYAHQIVQEDGIAEELVSGIFLKIWNRRHELHIQTSLKSYLFETTKNHALNHLRASKVRALSDWTTADEPLPPTPHDQLALQELYTQVDQWIDHLPHPRKAIFQMNRLHGYNIREIAAQMALSEGTVRNHLSLALKQMRTFLPQFFSVLLLLGLLTS